MEATTPRTRHRQTSTSVNITLGGDDAGEFVDERTTFMHEIPPEPSQSGSRFLALAQKVVVLGFLLYLMEYLSLVHYWLVEAPARDPCVVASEEMDNILKFQATDSAVPKIIHQQWKVSTLPSGKMTEWHEQWKTLFPAPEYKHIIWTDETARELISTHYSWFLDVYDSYDRNIKRADASRYFILHHMGGLYADLDFEPITNFWHRFPKDRVSVVGSPYRFNEKVQNSLMASPPGHPLWDIVFSTLNERSQVVNILEATGPKMLDEAIARAPHSYHYTLPCENFQRIPTGKAGEDTILHARVTREQQSRSKEVKLCGDANTNRCQFALHHNFISYWGGVVLKEKPKKPDVVTKP